MNARINVIGQHDLNGSFVKGCRYTGKDLLVKLVKTSKKGVITEKHYKYFNVPAVKVRALLAANQNPDGSVGGEYHKIKNSHRCVELAPEVIHGATV